MSSVSRLHQLAKMASASTDPVKFLGSVLLHDVEAIIRVFGELRHPEQAPLLKSLNELLKMHFHGDHSFITEPKDIVNALESELVTVKQELEKAKTELSYFTTPWPFDQK